MAATERDLPVVYVEALSYSADSIEQRNESAFSFEHLVHVWLLGDAYPPPARPPKNSNATEDQQA